MLIAKDLERVFLMQENNTEIRLADPEPAWSVEAVLNFYMNLYPILATAKISPAKIADDEVHYRFESVIGTKG